MSKIIQAVDILNDARGFLKCTWMAAADLGEPEETDAIQTVTNAAARQIEAAIALIEEYRTEKGDGPAPWLAAPRTNRRSK